MTRRRGLVLGIVAALLAAGVYLNTLHNPFVYDDHFTVLHNDSITDLGDGWAIFRGSVFRPLANLSFAVDHELWGSRPIGFHLSNVLLHVLNVLLLFRLTLDAVRDWTARDPGAIGHATAPHVAAFVAAALFAVHPMMTGAVGYVSARAELLCATFFLLAMLCLRAAIVGHQRWWLAPFLGSFALALASKEVAVMFPLVFLTYDRLLLGGTDDGRRRRLWRLHLPLVGFVVLAATARAAVFLWVENPTPRAAVVRMWKYLVVQFEVVWHYVALLVAPVSQSIFHFVGPSPRISALGAIGLVVVCLVAFRVRRQMPLVAFGVAWFLLVLVPSSSILPLQLPMAEHRVYLASGGLFMAAGAGFDWVVAALRRHSLAARLLPRVILILALAVLAGLAVARNNVWGDAITLWREAAMKAPHWHPYVSLGDALSEQGGCERALPAYREATRHAPRRLLPLEKVRECLVATGQVVEAQEVKARMLELDPDSTKICREFQAVASYLGKFEDCVASLRSAR